MPPKLLHHIHPQQATSRRVLSLLPACAALLAVGPAAGQVSDAVAVRSRSIELHHRIIDADPGTRVELWYTRDRGATWQRAPDDDDNASPYVFTAPAEGLYGFQLVLCDPQSKGQPPAAPEPRSAQRWVFIDYTPPLVQWDGVEAGDDFATRRTMHLRWTAYDDHLTARPVALAYQSSVQGTWQVIDPALPNTGRYDWALPAEVTGQVSIRLTVSDLGGHAVERTYGPVPVERWLKASKVNASATQPATVATTQPAVEAAPVMAGGPPTPADLEKRLKAQDLHRQGAAHLKDGRYALAAERFREALEADPDLLAAQCDLAGIYYLQQDYAKALELYHAILNRDPRYLPALRGASLAHGALRQYPQTCEVLKRLLAIKNKDAQAWFDLGDAMFMLGDTAAARAHWIQATTVDASAEAVIQKAKRRLELYGAGSSVSAAKPR